MAQVDEALVKPGAVPPVVDEVQWGDRQAEKIIELCTTTFRHFPDLPAPRLLEHRADGKERVVCSTYTLQTEDDVPVRIKLALPPDHRRPAALVVFALPEDCASGFMGASRCRPAVAPRCGTAGVEVRNTGATSVGPGYLWTLRRTYPLLGQTLPERQVYDLVQAMAVLREQHPGVPLTLYGQGRTAVLALYAAVMDELVSEVILADPPRTHCDPTTPEFLGVLRIGDLPHNLALLYPRPLTFVGAIPPAYEWTREAYEKLGRGELVRTVEKVGDWVPAG
jgi:hypothetical protein